MLCRIDSEAGDAKRVECDQIPRDCFSHHNVLGAQIREPDQFTILHLLRTEIAVDPARRVEVDARVRNGRIAVFCVGTSRAARTAPGRHVIDHDVGIDLHANRATARHHVRKLDGCSGS